MQARGVRQGRCVCWKAEWEKSEDAGRRELNRPFDLQGNAIPLYLLCVPVPGLQGIGKPGLTANSTPPPRQLAQWEHAK